MINFFKPIFLKNSKFKFQNVNYKAFSLYRLRKESERNQININRDYSNVKILLDDEETNKLEKIPIQNMTNNQSNINLTNDFTKDKRWTKDYTYPLDYNILKYKLKGIVIIKIHFSKSLTFYKFLDGEKTAWRKLPDEAV